jgi:SEC-C motif-containing protein
MKKITSNSLCPCGSHVKYKKCCAKYHKGALPKTALELMKSRYVAYAINDASYIIKTTHPNNPDYTDDTKAWKESIELFSKSTEFLGLEILEFIDGEEEAFVTFKAKLSSGDMLEKSRFLKFSNRWFYESAIFIE